jgi:Lrp/AsnC family leucine-responsive transcriptional regulator
VSLPENVFDEIDIEILSQLQKDGCLANAELAKRIGMSPSACLSRTRRLKESGVIRLRAAIVDEQRVGLGMAAFAFVTLGRHDRDAAESFLRRVQARPQVMECYHITGAADYMLKIVAPDISSYRDFLMDTLVSTADVAHVESRLVLRTEKRSFALPLPGRSGGK